MRRNYPSRLKQVSFSWYFLFLVVLLYLFLFLFNRENFFKSVSFFEGILMKILPVFGIVFVLMVVFDMVLSPQRIMRHLGGKGMKKWFYVIVGGVLSSGPIYMWYPLLAELRKKGLNYGLIACFLYNRAIKIPLIPVAVFYFGWRYVLILLFVMLIISVVQGVVIDLLMKENEKPKLD